MNKNILGSRGLFLVLAFMLAGVGSAQAAFPNNGFFLNMSQPDISSFGITTTYDASTGKFDADGFATSITPPGAPAGTITDGVFTLDANIDSATGMANNGSLSIMGSVGSSGPTLLTGILTGFGSVNGNDTLEFLFDVTGGDLAGDFTGPWGVGVQLNNTGFAAVSGFSTYTGNTPFTGSANTAVNVPEPGALVLMLGGVIGFAVRRWRLSAS